MDVVVDIGGAAVGGVKLRVGILDQILPREGPLKPWAGSGSPCACQCAVPQVACTEPHATTHYVLTSRQRRAGRQ